MTIIAAVLSGSQLFRTGLVSLLSKIGFEVEEGSDIGALKHRRNGKVGPDILLIQLSSEAEDVITSIEDVGSWQPAAKIVFLVADFDLTVMGGCFAAGASGFLLEDISPEAFESSLRLVCAGEKVFPTALASLLPGLTTKSSGPTINMTDVRNSHLSEREIEILRCLTDGQSNKVIANTLEIAESTVKVHVKRVMQKIHATNRTQAALWGTARGVTVTPSSTPNQITK